MVDIFQLVGKFIIQNEDANGAIDETTGKATKAETQIGKAFKAIGTAVATYLSVDAIKNFGTACVEAAADAQAMESQFSQVFGDLEGAAGASLSYIASEAGIAENRMKGSYTQIAAFAKTTGMETEDALTIANRAMVAVADSAAFYDRSLEDVTDSLQSFLKGNYANDAALGLSCTETTRNAAANELYGKSFNDLSEAQKQLTLLKMVEDANELSGAIGQAARESDTWTNQTGNLQQAWTDFKAEIGEYVLPTVVNLVSGLSDLVRKLTEYVDPAVQVLTEKFQDFKTWASDVGNYASETLTPIFDDLESAFIYVRDALKPLVDKLSDYITNGEAAEDATNLLKDAIDFIAEAYESVKEFIDDCVVAFQDVCAWVDQHRVGLELLASVIGIVTTAYGAYTVAQLIAKAGGIATIASNATLTVGYYALCAAEAVATAGASAFGAVMSFITSPITLVVAAIAAVIAIIVLCVKHWDEIKAKVLEVVTAILEWVSNLWEDIQAVFDGAVEAGAKIIESIKEGIANAWEGLVSWFSGIWDSLFGNRSVNVNVNASSSGSSGSSGGGSPRAGVEMYASGAVLNEPTAFAVNPYTGKTMIGGEDGAEAIAPISTLQQYVKAAVQDENSAMVQSLERIIDLLSQFFPDALDAMRTPMVCDTNGLAVAMAPAMNAELGRIAIKKGRGR